MRREWSRWAAPSPARVVAALLATLALVGAPAWAQLGRLPRPARVLLIGSSSIHHGFGEALDDTLTELGGIEVVNAGRSATGLARPDFFDWMAHARERVADAHPDLVVAQFGGNDCQALFEPNGDVTVRWDDAGWDAEYTRRVNELIEIARAAGATIVFVGMPRMQSRSFSSKIAHLNSVVEAAAGAAGVVYLSSWEATSDGDGPRATVQVDGRSSPMRDEDGIHLSVAGSRYVAGLLIEALGQTYDLRPQARAE